jgi:hypothetical protein
MIQDFEREMRHTCVLQFLVLCSRFSRRDSGVSFCSFDIRFEALHHVSDYVFVVKVETKGSASMFDDVVDLEVACQCREKSISP